MKKGKVPKFDENGFPVDQDSVLIPLIVCLIILVVMTFLLFNSGGGNGTITMPWGKIG
ncbi:MAG: hypothetical protein FWE95_05275 [Planctomycetaceae bacterium]|nr:hypothetical protein [Planctomycetaceae bacterium]